MQNFKNPRMPRELRHVIGFNLEDCEVEYLLRMKRKRDISQRKWGI